MLSKYHTFVMAMFEGGDPAAEAAAAEAAKAKGKTFTQEEVNTFVGKVRGEQKAKLEELQKNLNLTDEQRKTVEGQLEELRTANLTETEKLKRQLEVGKTEYEAGLKKAKDSEESWKGRFTSSRIETELTNASATESAFNPLQIRSILGPNARLVETLDEAGKPSGNFAVKVKVQTIGSDKKPIELELSPAEAVKTLKEQPEFANLFKGTHVPGLGGGNGSHTRGQPIDLRNLTPEQYMELRKTNPQALGLPAKKTS